MNPDQPSRDEIEAKLTALLLGELPEEEARLLRWAVSQDAGLAKLHDQLELAIGLVRTAGKNPAATPGEHVPLKLSDERRKKLLAHFQTPRPKELFWLKRIEVPPLVTVLVVVAVIAVLAAMMLPVLSTAKSRSSRARIVAASSESSVAEQHRYFNPDVSAITPTVMPPPEVVTALPPEPTLSPPPMEIVLPKTETAAEVAQNETPAASTDTFSTSNFRNAAGASAAAPPSPAPLQLPATVNFALSKGDVALQSRVTDPANFDRIPQVSNDKLGANTLVQDGKLLYETGKFTQSEDKMNQALKLDADNSTALYYLNLKKQADLARVEIQHADDTQARMEHVEKQWVLPKEVKPLPSIEAGRGPIAGVAPNQAPDSSGNKRDEINGNNQPQVATLAGVVAQNRLSGTGGGRGGRGGGGFGGGGGGGGGGRAVNSTTAEPAANAISLGLNDSGTDRSRAEVQTQNGWRDGSASAPVASSGGEFNLNYQVNNRDISPVPNLPTGGFPGAAGNGPAGGNARPSPPRGAQMINNSFDSAGEVAAVQNQTIGGQNFYRNDVSESDAEIIPTLGNVPKMGNAFVSRNAMLMAPTAAPAPSGASVQSSVEGFYDDSYAAGNSAETAKELLKSSSDTSVLNGGNIYLGRTTVNAGELALDAAKAPAPSQDFAANLGATMPSDRDQNVYQTQLHNADPQQVTAELKKMFPSASPLRSNSSSQNSLLQQHTMNRSVSTEVSKEPPKPSSDTLALNGTNVYSGETILNAGTIALNVQPSAPAPTPTLDGQQLQTFNQQQIDDEKIYKEQLVQLQELKSIQTNNPEKLHEVLPQVVQDAVLNDLLSKLHEVQQKTVALTGDYATTNFAAIQNQSLKDELNREVDDRVHGIVAGQESKANSMKAALDALTASAAAKQKDQKEADVAIRKPPTNAPIPQPEILTRENAFSTFSLNVSDVSFKLAAASLEKGRMPDAASIRSEEFINAFDYRDPEAAAGQPVAFASERARYPFAQNRDLLRFSIKTAAAGHAADRPLNLVLLLDTSGSMERADRVAIIREAMRVLATQLHPQDTVSVVTFARTARLWADGVAGDKAGETLSQVGGITPEGGTNLEEAMRLAYETARRHYLANGINRVVLLTDGAANLGNVDAAALKQKVEAQRKQGIALDCFGIGWEDFNDDMLAELSGNGDGRYAFINSPEEAGTEFAAKLAGALQVAVQDVKVQVEFNPQRVISWRQIGYAKHQLTKEQFRDNSVLAAEIAVQEAGNALYTVETKPDGTGPVATVYVRYKVPGTEDVQEHSWDVPYAGNAVSLKQSSAAMRLAATASAFSEWLAASPFAQEVTPDELLKELSGVPEIYGADQRPKKLEWMIRQAKSLSGK